MHARVVVLAGPSGSGKSHLAERLGWPLVRLDDFYRDGDAAEMPRSSLGIIDWDDAASWDAGAACAAIETLCREGRVDIPVYDIARSKRTGHPLIQTKAPLSSRKDCSHRRSSPSARRVACWPTPSACGTTGH